MTTLLSVAQMNSQDSIDENLLEVERLIQESIRHGASLLVLPENVACFAPGKQLETAQRFDEIKSKLESLATQYQIWLVAGTLPCPYRPNGQPVPNQRVRTVSLCISPEKTEIRYDKIHLFDVDVSDGIGRYQESRYFEAGDRIVTAQTPFGIIGLMVCYDLRFPELALNLRQKGANILTAPAAFTYSTGQLHWQLLLQARALDSQCHILGAAQQGWHCDQRQTWGHAAIVNSQGKLLQMTQNKSSQVITQPFDLFEQESVRRNMPLMQHRRLIQY